MRVLRRIIHLSLVTPTIFVAALVVSLILVRVVFQLRDLSALTWEVRTEWSELDSISNDVLLYRIDSVTRLETLSGQWEDQTARMDLALQRLIRHPRINTLPEDVRSELVRATYVWRFSLGRLQDAQELLRLILGREEFLSELFSSGEASLFGTIRLQLARTDRSYTQREDYLRLIANLNVLGFTSASLSDILAGVNERIPSVSERYAVVLMVIVAVALASAAAYTSIALGQLIAPIRRIAHTVHSIGESDPMSYTDPCLHVAKDDEVAIIERGVGRLVHRVTQLNDRSLDAEKAQRTAEVRALQYQINPHFLYNTLGTLQLTASLNGQEYVASSLRSLSRLLRNAIRKANRIISFAEEIEIVEDYIRIIQGRYHNRLIVETEIGERAMATPVPGQILQPVIENAVVHGLNHALNTEDGVPRIVLRAWVDEERLLIEVSDNGCGIDPEVVATLVRTPRDGSTDRFHIGLANIHERLRMVYGEPFGLVVTSHPGTGTTVRYTIPIRPEATDGDQDTHR